MTADFDSIACIGRSAQEDCNIKPLALWLAGIATTEASSRDPSWSIEKWKRRHPNCQEMFGEFLEFEFLNDTHSQLDHTQKWHLKVLEPTTSELIGLIQSALEKEGNYLFESKLTQRWGKTSIIDRFPDVKERLKASGFSYDQNMRAWRYSGSGVAKR